MRTPAFFRSNANDFRQRRTGSNLAGRFPGETPPTAQRGWRSKVIVRLVGAVRWLPTITGGYRKGVYVRFGQTPDYPLPEWEPRSRTQMPRCRPVADGSRTHRIPTADFSQRSSAGLRLLAPPGLDFRQSDSFDRPKTKFSRNPLQRFPIGTNSRVSCPIQTWRGRAIFCSGSVNISCHCESQPMVRGIANSTVNISGLKPIA